jgi:transposase
VFFESWFKECLLEAIPKGHTAIMGNARFHRKKALRKLAKRQGTAVISATVFT